MTQAAVVLSREATSTSAGAEIGEELRAQLHGEPDAVIVFASSRHDHEPLLASIMESCRPRCLVGSSSAGEHAGSVRAEGTVSALALRSDSMRFAVGVGKGMSADRGAAAQQVARSFLGRGDSAFAHRTAIVMADVLAGHTDELLQHLRDATGGSHRLVGGGAGDDGLFHKTHVFAGTRAYTDAVVALEILSAKPIGIGVSHGWSLASPVLRVTEASGALLRTLNGIPAMEIFEEHAQETGQTLDAKDPFSFFLRNIIGIEAGDGFLLRVPLAVDQNGAIAFAAEVPKGAVVRIMTSTASSVIDAAAAATRTALAGLCGAPPAAALFFDCVATRLGLREMFDAELDGVRQLLGPARMAGCNTYGQIAPVGGLQNCNAVACVFPS